MFQPVNLLLQFLVFVFKLSDALIFFVDSLHGGLLPGGFVTSIIPENWHFCQHFRAFSVNDAGSVNPVGVRFFLVYL